MFFMCGCNNLSRNAEAVCVGQFVQEIMGRIFSRFLCSLGKKYMDCVDVSSGR